MWEDPVWDIGKLFVSSEQASIILKHKKNLKNIFKEKDTFPGIFSFPNEKWHSSIGSNLKDNNGNVTVSFFIYLTGLFNWLISFALTSA